jgi:hypothetical protein
MYEGVQLRVFQHILRHGVVGLQGGWVATQDLARVPDWWEELG